MMRIRTLVLAGAAVAALAYLFDPREGSVRRQRLRATLGGLAARRTRGVDRPTPLPENVAPTAAAPETAPKRPEPTASVIPPAPDRTRAPGSTTSDDPDDAEVVRRVKERLEERRDLVTEELVVDVVNGVAYLAGDLHDPHTFGEIVDLTRDVPGVRRVQSLLHLPDSETVMRTISARRVGEGGEGSPRSD
jgi:hypothetical protein